MRKKITEVLEIPQGISCEYNDKILKCKSDIVELKRKIAIFNTSISITDNLITINSDKGRRNEKKAIQSSIIHIKNMFKGLKEKYEYKLEACNVHFPMTLKTEGNKLWINNFLGEKTPRHAVILPNVDIQIKGQSITIASHDKEAAGQTAANFERATKVSNRDRRIFQDGIYIIEKPGEKKR